MMSVSELSSSLVQRNLIQFMYVTEKQPSGKELITLAVYRTYSMYIFFSCFDGRISVLFGPVPGQNLSSILERLMFQMIISEPALIILYLLSCR